MAGAMTAWIADTWHRRSSDTPLDPPISPSFFDRVTAAVTPLTVTCGVLAISPDFDFFLHSHRTYTHSLGAVGIVWLLVAFAAWRLRLPVVKVATTCAAAYASHVLLDWAGRDDSAAGGLMVLWPLTSDFYRLGLPLFLEINGHPRAAMAHPIGGFLRILALNREAFARELLILGPLFLLVLRLRLRRWTQEGLPEPESARRDQGSGIGGRLPLNPDPRSLRLSDELPD